MATETVDKTLAEMTIEELMGEFRHQTERLEGLVVGLLSPRVPKSSKQRAAELGLRVVKGESDAA